MGIALVSAGAPSGSLSPSFGQATGPGDLLIAWLYCNSSDATSPFSTPATGWAAAASGGQPFNWSGIWYRMNSGSSEAAPAFSAGGASAYWSMLGEFSGAATSSALDQAGTSAGSGGATQSTTAAGPDGASGELVIYACGWNGGTPGLTMTNAVTDGSGASLTPAVYNDSGSGSGFYYNFLWAITVATGASGDAATGTLSGFENGACCLASFKAGGAPAAPAYAPPVISQFSGLY